MMMFFKREHSMLEMIDRLEHGVNYLLTDDVDTKIVRVSWSESIPLEVYNRHAALGVEAFLVSRGGS